MVQRQGKVNVHQVEDVKTDTLTKEITDYIAQQANVFTDEYIGYNKAYFMYNHQIVHHTYANGEFVVGNVTTNTIESFWTTIKRGIKEIYHLWSKKHLQLYLDEFVFRYNTRDKDENWQLNFLLANSTVRTTYKELIYG